MSDTAGTWANQSARSRSGSHRYSPGTTPSADRFAAILWDAVLVQKLIVDGAKPGESTTSPKLTTTTRPDATRTSPSSRHPTRSEAVWCSQGCCRSSTRSSTTSISRSCTSRPTTSTRHNSRASNGTPNWHGGLIGAVLAGPVVGHRAVRQGEAPGKCPPGAERGEFGRRSRTGVCGHFRATCCFRRYA